MIQYMDDQKIACTVLNHAIQSKAYSHAYLFETNGYVNSKKLIIDFIKEILCSNDERNCEHCYQCEQIENGTFSELKIITPDGLWIKKEQLGELQEEFSTTSIESKYRVYIIQQADKLNASAANSILKFLEEPEDNIIAILVTDNIYQVLNTIISRCQVIRLSPSVIGGDTFAEKLKIAVQNQFSDILVDSLELQAKHVEDFIQYYEMNGINTILKIQKLWHNQFRDRESTLLGFDLMILYYKDLIYVKLNKEPQVFEDNNWMRKIIQKNSLTQLIQKMNKIIKLKEYNKVNINLNLLMDKLILEMEGVEK